MSATESKATVEVGDVYDVYGEEIEVTNESDDRVCLHYKDRDAPQGGLYVTWRGRELINEIATDEEWTLIDSEDDEEAEPLGEWVRTPRCPECGAWMDRGHDPEGFPIARCQKMECDGWMDDNELFQGRYVVEA